MSNPEEIYYQFHVDPPAVRGLYYAVTVAIEQWPGGDPEQQATLHRIKNKLEACLLEMTLDNS